MIREDCKALNITRGNTLDAGYESVESDQSPTIDDMCDGIAWAMKNLKVYQTKSCPMKCYRSQTPFNSIVGNPRQTTPAPANTRGNTRQVRQI